MRNHHLNVHAMSKQMEFSHYWVSGFGWENTIYQPEDFVTVEEMGFNDIDGHIFLGINDKGGKHILKGVYKTSQA